MHLRWDTRVHISNKLVGGTGGAGPETTTYDFGRDFMMKDTDKEKSEGERKNWKMLKNRI